MSEIIPVGFPFNLAELAAIQNGPTFNVVQPGTYRLLAFQQSNVMLSPDESDQRQHVYVLDLTGGGVKVGRSGNPSKRVQEHAREAAKYGASIRQTWVSEPITAYVDAEDALIRFCLERWNLASGREYFAGASFDEVVQFGRSLPVDPPLEIAEPGTSAQERRRMEWADICRRDSLVAAATRPSIAHQVYGETWRHKLDIALGDAGAATLDDDAAVLLVRETLAGLSDDQREDALNRLILAYWGSYVETGHLNQILGKPGGAS
jgi:hypothetical protein